jgi:adenylate cyclase
MARLSLTIDGQRRIYPILSRQLRIGRALDNDIVLNHAIVSRYHAVVEVGEVGEVGAHARIVRDLGSRNGVFVNRLRIKQEQLSDGDLIQVGPFELRFEERAALDVVLDDDRYFALANDARPVLASELPAAVPDLQSFCRIMAKLNTALTQRELFEVVIDEVLGLIPAERAFLLIKRAGELVPMVVRPDSGSALAISKTIVRQALEGGVAVLTRDARIDFAGSDSIISQNIRSALCVPLMTSEGPIGIILLDSPGRERFGNQHRDLLVAVAGQAAIAIERARLTEELHRQEQVLANLERFMSPNVAELVARHLAQHGKLWEAEELAVTVLFADVEGFTRLSERLRPHEVQDLLNEYLHEMTDVVFRFGGTLDKYIGDGLMAVFGAPRLPNAPTSDDHATHALDAALEMLVAHKRLLGKLDPHKSFNMRIGLNSGLVYAGFFGTRHRLEYTVLGDTVNTAARLESAAQPNNILASAAVAELAHEDFVFEPVGALRLKGREQLVQAHRVLGRAQAAGLSLPEHDDKTSTRPGIS